MSKTYYDAIRKHIKEAGEGKVEKSEIAWSIAEAGAAVVDGILESEVLGPAGSAVMSIYTLIHNNPNELPPNPWFVWNDHDDKKSPMTWKYMKKRGYIDAFASMSNAASAGLALVTVVDIGALAQHGYSNAATISHLKKFYKIAKAYKHSETISAWIHLIIAMKEHKIEVRGSQLAISAASALPGLSTAVSALSTAMAAGAKLGIKLKFSTVCTMTAMELHWRAYQEHVLLENTEGGTGPAIRILEELFSRSGVLATLLGKHDIDTIVREPAGWMAISDKLLLI